MRPAGRAPAVLRALVPLYRAGLALDRAWKRRRAVRLPLPVVSVGNVTVGGTGKTPVLLSLLEQSIAHGIHPAVLTRGYRGGVRSAHPPAVILGMPAAQKASDEIRLMAQRFPATPIGAGRDREKSARLILASHHPHIFFLDDGFQHWRLRRDLDIVCVDATDPWGGGVLPAGRGRESASALGRARAIVVTRTELVSNDTRDRLVKAIRRLSPEATVAVTQFDTTLVDPSKGAALPWSVVRNRAVLAVSAIGNPGAFESRIRSFCREMTLLRFPDHAEYDDQRVSQITASARRADAAVVATEKDWVKLSQTDVLDRVPDLFVARLELRFDEGWATICRRVMALAGRPPS